MAGLGSLTVKLGLDAAEFTAGLTKSQYQAQQFVTNFKASFAGNLLADFVQGFVRDFARVPAALIEGIASYKQFSEQIGSSASEFSGLQAASDLSGVALDTVAKASVRLTAGLSKNSEEAKDTAAALGAIGISFADFKKQNPVQQLETVALQLAKFQDGAAKTAVAVQLFGRAGAELLPFLNDLADAGGKQTRLTEEQIKAADDLTKQLARLRTEFADLARSVTADAVPALSRFLEKTNEIRKSSILGFLTTSGAQEQNAGAEINKITESLERLRIQRDKLDPGKGFANKLNDIVFGDVADLDRQMAVLEKQKAYLKSVQATQALATAEGITDERRFQPTPPAELNFRLPSTTKDKAPKVSEAQRYLEALMKQRDATVELTTYEKLLWDIQQGRLDGVTPKLQAVLEGLAREIDARKSATLEMEKEAALQDLIASAQQRDVEAQNKITEQLREQAEAYLDLADPMREFLRKLEEIDALVAKGFLNEDQAKAIKQNIGDLGKPLEEMDEFAKSAAQNIQSAFADFLFDPFKDGLDGLAKNFAQIIQRMIAEAAAAAILKSLFGEAGLAGSLGGLFGGAGAKAVGGGVHGGAPYVVGERGPELFKPNASGVIVPNGKFGGNTSLTQNITINGGSQMSEFKMRQAMRESTLAVVSDARGRGRAG